MKYRVERDSLGEVEVPADALFGAQTQRAVDNFPISGLPLPPMFISALGQIKSACAEANAELGLLSPDVAAAIAAAADQVAMGEHAAAFPVDVFQTGSGTSTNMNANEVIAALASRALGKAVHPNDDVNRGQSSNDVIPSCIHLGAATAVQQQLLPALQHLCAVIDRRAVELVDVVKTGRTHLMDAMPVTLGQELGAWRQQLQGCVTRIEQTQPRLCQLALGGTAVGTGVNAPPGFADAAIALLARRTGLPLRAKDNYFEALSAQDVALQLSADLKSLAVVLMKIGNDLRWMNSGPLAGIGEIQLPAVQPGSSIMPGKVNPVIAEAVCMASAQVMGNDTTITVAAQSGNFQLNVMLPVVAYNLLQSIELMANAAPVLADKAIAGFVVNTDRINALLDRNPILVTALNDRIGYEQGAAIAKRAFAEQRPVLDVAVEVTGIDRDELQRLLDPKNLTG